MDISDFIITGILRYNRKNAVDLKVVFENGREDTITINLSDNLMDNVNRYISLGDKIGVKGAVHSDIYGNTQLIGTSLSILKKNNGGDNQ